MKNKCSKLPVIIIVIGLILTIAASLIVSMVRVPVTTEYDFNYSATYKLDGEVKTINGVYRCRFSSADNYDRYYEGTYISDNSLDGSSEHIIATKDNLNLCIEFIFTSNYLMGDGDSGELYSEAVSEPYIAIYDKNEGYEYTDFETFEKFDVELVSWELPEAIDNSFVFSHITRFNYTVVFPTIIVAVLCLVAIIIFVKREKQSELKGIDIVTVVLNFAICATLLPFTLIAAVLIDVNGSGPELYRQFFYFFPSFIAFCTAASVALRRRGHSVKSLVAELVGPVAFGIYLIVCAVLGLL